VGLEVGVLDALGVVSRLHYRAVLSRGDAVVDPADFAVQVGDEIVWRVVVQDGRAGFQRVLGVEYGG
jgi:hypothetical protein